VEEMVHINVDLLKKLIWESCTGIPWQQDHYFSHKRKEKGSICITTEKNTNKWNSKLSKRQLSVLTFPQNTWGLHRNSQSIQTVQNSFATFPIILKTAEIMTKKV